MKKKMMLKIINEALSAMTDDEFEEMIMELRKMRADVRSTSK